MLRSLLLIACLPYVSRALFCLRYIVAVIDGVPVVFYWVVLLICAQKASKSNKNLASILRLCLAFRLDNQARRRCKDIKPPFRKTITELGALGGRPCTSSLSHTRRSMIAPHDKSPRSRRPRFRGKGFIGGGVGAYTYDWVGEQWLATWLAEERVVEAILGESCHDADTAGATAAANKGEGSQGGRDKPDRQVCHHERVPELWASSW